MTWCGVVLSTVGRARLSHSCVVAPGLVDTRRDGSPNRSGKLALTRGHAFGL